jgi:hypothetical protein
VLLDRRIGRAADLTVGETFIDVRYRSMGAVFQEAPAAVGQR